MGTHTCGLKEIELKKMRWKEPLGKTRLLFTPFIAFSSVYSFSIRNEECEWCPSVKYPVCASAV